MEFEDLETLIWPVMWTRLKSVNLYIQTIPTFFSWTRNTLVDKPQLKKISFQNYNYGYLIQSWSDKDFKGTIVNRSCHMNEYESALYSLRPNLKSLSCGLNLSHGSNMVPFKIVFNFSRFKPAFNLNRFLADLSHGSMFFMLIGQFKIINWV